MRRTCIFGGLSHPELTDFICEKLGRKPDKVELRKFANGETSVEIKTSVRDQAVFIVQSGSHKTNDDVMELLIMIAACKGGSAKSVTAVMPYFPYSRQSKKKSHRGAITARMIANLMHVAGVNHVVTIDLHASQMQGFFKCPVDNLVAEPLLARWIRSTVENWKEGVVVSKNPGGTKRVTSLADALKLSFGIVTTDTRRPNMGQSMYNSVVYESATGENMPPIEVQSAASEEINADQDTTHPDHTIEHDFAPQPGNSKPSDYASSELRPDHFHRRPAKQRSSTSYTSRLLGAPALPSPLAQFTRPDSSDGLQNEEPVDTSHRPTRPSFDLDGAPKMHRTATALGLGPVESPAETIVDNDDEDDGDEYTDERARNVITGRLIHGHLVDDDFPSPVMSAMSSSTPGLYPMRSAGSDDEEVPDHMVASFMSNASSRRPDFGLGGTGDATASDDEEEEALQDPELETTITLVGNVRDRPVFIVDDIIDKAGSWIAAAETVVKRGGATKVVCMATHGLFGGDCLREMDECEEIDAIVVTNAFPIPKEKREGIRKLVILDVSTLLAEAIRRNHHGESISQLYMHHD
ncbi:phosphoribosyl pyrophosphokinase [Aureobasidium subglaciale]|nr:phosphoribosyl pyrophosphokinase [Aureobasidium subglaciale]KAI5225640.1 phosphoribosyl pyrophosphokinase [Aureobasidium subglaciale]KAI5229138.1 phosphoribosyl pyrophosphokinase [Aureobasidium subglaciale]KAI5263928.1 phosphoribosyl pyrophosphokinase [Aureobasidium subglaciale]